jgi:hypothetical protein
VHYLEAIQLPNFQYDSLTGGTSMIFTMDSSTYSQSYYTPIQIIHANKDGSLRDQHLTY